MKETIEIISDSEEKRCDEIMLIRDQIMYADGVDDDEYSAWKSILEKVRKYNEEHE